jgi:hypothetical protein
VKLTIVLRKQDALGLGGQILEAMGMKRSVYEPEVFVVQHIQDPRLVAPVDVLESMWPVMYVEALMDEGIRPIRVFQRTDSTVGLTPLFASAAKPNKLAVADLLEATANALEAGEGVAGCGCEEGVCQCGDACVPGPDGNCQVCGLPTTETSMMEVNPMDTAIGALTELAEFLADDDLHSHINNHLNASKGVIDMKTWKTIREKANAALEKAGFDGNGRFRTIGQANSKLAEVLSNFGLQLADVMSADRFREPSKTQNFSLEFVNPQDSFSPVAFDDSMVHYSYAKLAPDRVEVVAYLS